MTICEINERINKLEDAAREEKKKAAKVVKCKECGCVLTHNDIAASNRQGYCFSCD
jgi:hypothetical protein